MAIEVEDYERAPDILLGAPTLMAADAVHIAAAQGIALAGARVTFITVDERQARAAAGLVDEVRLLA